MRPSEAIGLARLSSVERRLRLASEQEIGAGEVVPRALLPRSRLAFSVRSTARAAFALSRIGLPSSGLCEIRGADPCEVLDHGGATRVESGGALQGPSGLGEAALGFVRQAEVIPEDGLIAVEDGSPFQGHQGSSGPAREQERKPQVIERPRRLEGSAQIPASLERRHRVVAGDVQINVAVHAHVSAPESILVSTVAEPAALCLHASH